MNETLWLLGRGTGVAALLLLTLSMGLGVLTAGRYVSKEVPRFALTEIHRRASLAATVLLGVHLVSLWADPVAPLRAVDLLVPFLGARNPVWWGLGTLGMDLVAVLVVTSLLRSRMPYGVWRRLHWLSYATWPLAFLHALGSGTDAGPWWLRGGGARVLRRGGGGRRIPPRGNGRGALDGPARPGQSTAAGGS
jgi:sulfoxide reductase heme-binding subunit YedZ